MKDKKLNGKLGMLLVVVAATIWAWTGTAGQILSQEKQLDVYWIVSVRLIMAGIVLFAISTFKMKKAQFVIWKNKKDAGRLVLFAIMGSGLMQISYFACIAKSNAATATILQYIAPAIVIAASVVKNRKRPSKMDAICTILALAGVFCIGTHGSLSTLAITPVALIWGLVSAVSMAFYTAYPLQLMKKYGTTVILSWGLLLAGIVMCAYSKPWKIETPIDGESIFLMTVLILLGTVFAFSIFSTGASVIGGAKASILGTVEPIVSAIIGFFVFRQRFGLFDYIGIACIISITVLIAIAEMTSEKKRGSEIAPEKKLESGTA